jgi:hypothetical protein
LPDNEKQLVQTDAWCDDQVRLGQRGVAEIKTSHQSTGGLHAISQNWKTT